MVGDEITFFLDETYCSLALACLKQEENEEAVAAAQRALKLAQESNNQEYVGAAWRVLGQVAAKTSSVHVDETDYSAATCFAKSLRVFKDIAIEGEQAKTLNAWAEYELQHGDRTKGEAMQQEAQTLLAKLCVKKTQETCPEIKSLEHCGEDSSQ
jgi:hypothetical protein